MAAIWPSEMHQLLLDDGTSMRKQWQCRKVGSDRVDLEVEKKEENPAKICLAEKEKFHHWKLQNEKQLSAITTRGQSRTGSLLLRKFKHRKSDQ